MFGVHERRKTGFQSRTRAIQQWSDPLSLGFSILQIGKHSNNDPDVQFLDFWLKVLGVKTSKLVDSQTRLQPPNKFMVLAFSFGHVSGFRARLEVELGDWIYSSRTPSARELTLAIQAKMGLIINFQHAKHLKRF